MHAVGDVVDGRYRLERRLGEGVFLAQDVSLDRAVAVRIAAPEDAAELAFEAGMIRSLSFSTSHVVPALDEGDTDEGGRYLVSAFVEGTPVEWLASSGRTTPPGTSASIGEGLLEAAEAAQRSLPAGRTAVPESAILDRDGELKVTRFGFTDGDGPAVCAAVGAQLHRLLTGVPPRPGESVRDHGVEVPEALADVVDESLAGQIRASDEMRRRLSAARRRMA